MSTNEPPPCTPYRAGDEEGGRAWSFADVAGPPRPLSRDGSPHVTDEVVNSASHLAAAMTSVLGLVLLVAQSGGNAWKVVSFGVYGASLVNLFVCSTLVRRDGGRERRFKVFLCVLLARHRRS